MYIECSDIDHEEFKEAVQPVYDTWREIAGAEIVDAWLATAP